MQDIQQICHHYQLGEMTAPPEVVTGGTLHRIWRVKTKIGDFAVKRLNKDHYALLGAQHLNTDQTQLIVDELLAAEIQTHQAIRHSSGYEIAHDNASFVVFKWIEGECIDQTRLSANRAFKIGQLLAKLHAVNVSLPGLQLPTWKGLTTHEWHLLAEQSLVNNLSWSDLFCSHLGDLVRWSEEARQSVGSMTDHLVISHRDLNIFNIVWTPTEEPVMIDWELGGLIHPDTELFIVAMNWSFTGTQILESAFKAVFSGYQFSKSVDVTPLLRSYQGYLIDWLIFNVRRSLAYPEQQDIALSEINYVIQVLQYLDRCEISTLQGLIKP